MAATATKTWTQVRSALDETLGRMGVTAYTLESPFENAKAVEKRKAGRAPQTEEQRAVTLTVDLGPIWRGHAEARHIRITAQKRETAVENLDALQRAFETIRLTAVRNLDGIVFRVYRQMFPEPHAHFTPPPPRQEQARAQAQRPPSRLSGAFAVLHVADNAPLAVAEAAYRALVKDAHPDVGGNHTQMVALNAAIQTIRLHLAPARRA